MKAKVIAVRESQVPDRNNPEIKNKLYRATCLLEDGIVEIWTTKQVYKDDEVDLVIKAGRNYKAKVAIA